MNVSRVSFLGYLLRFGRFLTQFPPSSGTKEKKASIMKEAGVREHQRLKDAQRRV